LYPQHPEDPEDPVFLEVLLLLDYLWLLALRGNPEDQLNLVHPVDLEYLEDQLRLGFPCHLVLPESLEVLAVPVDQQVLANLEVQLQLMQHLEVPVVLLNPAYLAVQWVLENR